MEKSPKEKHEKKLTPIWRTIVEVGFIVFLFYSNLLMGQFTRSKIHQGNDILLAIEDIFTITNFAIAIILALIGHLVFDYLRKRL